MEWVVAERFKYRWPLLCSIAVRVCLSLAWGPFRSLSSLYAERERPRGVRVDAASWGGTLRRRDPSVPGRLGGSGVHRTFVHYSRDSHYLLGGMDFRRRSGAASYIVVQILLRKYREQSQSLHTIGKLDPSVIVVTIFAGAAVDNAPGLPENRASEHPQIP